MYTWWKKLGIVCGILLVLSQPEVLNRLIAFIIAGVIPGLGIVLPFWLTMLVTASAGIVLVYWLMRQPLFIGDSVHQEKRAKAAARAEVIRIAAQSKKPSTRSKKPHLRKQYRPVHSTTT